MAQRVDLPKEITTKALELLLASLRRANNNERNPIIVEARQKEIAALQNAINTITETK